ncbi:NnrU family protein [Desertibaculum subflavum]|uniref:NnrU family protein n=1 Tax=Desertibaculum subflavum TaxID=2268458 RepID=UPI000E65EBCE
MEPAQTHLLAAAAFWLAVHIGLAGTALRGRLIGALGANGFRGLFSVLSVVGLGLLIWTYNRAGQPEAFLGLWAPERWTYWVPFLVMPVALLLFVGSVTAPNPTAVGAEGLLQRPDPARGILRITRHPMLWSFVLWAAAHMVPNGDFASLVLFATILVTALYGMPSIDRKRAAADPRGWAAYAGKTSIVPFAAIVSGRNQLVLSEIGLWRIAVALVAWIVLFVVHGPVLGVSAIPF